MLILPIQEYGRSFHFLVSSSISFFKALKFLSNRSFTSLVRVTPRYFMLFVNISWKVMFLISLCVSLFFVYRRTTDFFGVYLVSCHSTKGVDLLLEFSGRVFGFAKMYTIISSANNESLTSSFPIRIPWSLYAVLLLLLELQALYGRGMERVDSLVLFLIFVGWLWVSFHLI